MPRRTSKTGSELFIVDNSDEEWKVLRYLHDWCQLSKAIDVATGYFEIGSLLALKDEWQKVDSIRILMGDEFSKRTKAAFIEGLRNIEGRLDASIEVEKEKNDFLLGVPAIVEGIRSGKIQCRVYRKDKFHAKCYLTHARQEVIGSFALVGSSNLTYPGITENIELNVQISGTPVAVLQEWYEQHWNDAEDVTADMLRVIERHVLAYSPFEVYVKALQEFFRGHELTASEWELAGPDKNGSRVYPILDQYQREGYQSVMKIARQHGGAFLCDGVGLGKTFVGLMLIERLIMHEGKNVALFVPKSANEPVWRRAIKRYLPHIGTAFSNLRVFNHTDLQRAGEFPALLDDIKLRADAILVDEAHHFRNPGVKGAEDEDRRSRYRRLFDLVEGPKGNKEVFMLTATPINNGLHDFRHMAELFTRNQDNYFAQTIGVHSMRGHFVSMERQLRKATEQPGDAGQLTLFDASELMTTDLLFKALVVQRSRAYVRKSQEQQGSSVAMFPVREHPRVASYELKRTYGRLLTLVEDAFKRDKPLFALAIYYPLWYYKGEDKDDVFKWEENQQKQVCGLIRTQFLKRFESSAYAFEQSCNRLLIKLLAWVTKFSQTPAEIARLDRWKRQNTELVGYVRDRQLLLFDDEHDADEAEADEDLVTDEMLAAIQDLDRDEYRIEDILADTMLDLEEIAKFLNELRNFQVKHDDKLKALVKLLKSDSELKKRKVLIFTEFAETARYLKRELEAAGIDGIEQIDSGSKKDRAEVLRRFAPYYNESSSGELKAEGCDEIRVLISTDVLSEGLNLQDATRLINYDIHWNPVRLMQRIGRVDRRMNPEIEARLLADHTELKTQRGRIVYWNFIPPDELETLLSLFGKVAHKTLRISKTLGIEGQKLLTPDDDFEALKDFNHQYEGTVTDDEKMRLELQELLKADPTLAARLDVLPGRVFSGKRHLTPGTRAVFLCYRVPRPDHSVRVKDGDLPWTEEAGETRWFLYDIAKDKIIEEPTEIVDVIRCVPDTPRHCEIEQATLVDIRQKIDKHLKNTHLKRLQAPLGVKPSLKAWLELN